MPGALDWLRYQLGEEDPTATQTGLRTVLERVLGNGDPEAAGAAQTSLAMQPAVTSFGTGLGDYSRGFKRGFETSMTGDPIPREDIANMSRPEAFGGALGGAFGYAPGSLIRGFRHGGELVDKTMQEGPLPASQVDALDMLSTSLMAAGGGGYAGEGGMVLGAGPRRPRARPLGPAPETPLSPLDMPPPGSGHNQGPPLFSDVLRAQQLERPDALPLAGNKMAVTPPPHITDDASMDALVQRYADLVLSGRIGRHWYEQSGDAILEHAGNPETATAFAAGLARTSPQTDVASNLVHAVTAHNQAMAGLPIQAGRFPNAMGADLEKIYFEGQPVTGEKIGPFMGAVAQQFNPDLFAHNFVNDIWNMRASEYPGEGGKPYSGSPSLGQHNFARILADQVRDRINSMEGESGWTPQQVQAAGWSGIKARDEGTPVEESAFNFGDALRRSYGQASWESAPGMTSGHFPEYHDAPWDMKQAYHDDIVKALSDENGRDIIASHLGLLTGKNVFGPGYFEGRVNPGTQTPVVLGGTAKGIDPASAELLNTQERIRGILLRQDAIAYHKPVWTDAPIGKHNLADIDIGRQLTPDEAIAVARAMHAETGSDFFSPITSDKGFRFLNVPEASGVSNKIFRDAALRVMEKADLPDYKFGSTTSHSFYEPNDWSKNPNGEGYRSGLAVTRSPDLQRRAAELLATLGKRVAEVDDRYAAQHGWTHGPQNRWWEDPQHQGLLQDVIPNPPRPGGIFRAGTQPPGPDYFGAGGVLDRLRQQLGEPPT